MQNEEDPLCSVDFIPTSFLDFIRLEKTIATASPNLSRKKGAISTGYQNPKPKLMKAS
jgi:hypothetical protein